MRFSTIFCIGLNKTGTVSLHQAFVAAGLRSLHDKKWVDFAKMGKLPDYEAFSDGSTEQLDLQSLVTLRPNSIIILNTRSLFNWLVSRCKHAREGFRRGNRRNYVRDDLLVFIDARQTWHSKAMKHSPFVFNIENQLDHQRLSDFLELELKINHWNKRDIPDKELQAICDDVKWALGQKNIAEANWHDVI